MLNTGQIHNVALLWVGVLWATATFPSLATASVTRAECVDSLHGIIVGDIGNGAIFQSNYRCDSNGQPPLDVILPGPGEPIATEGEVCCGTTSATGAIQQSS